MKTLSLPATLLALLAVPAATAAQQPPSFARQVKPFLDKYCLECHNPAKLEKGLNLESFARLKAGGDTGSVVVPGKPGESRLVLLAEGKEEPKMPPKKAKQPRPDEVAVLRAWVAAGARDDTAAVAAVHAVVLGARLVSAGNATHEWWMVGFEAAFAAGLALAHAVLRRRGVPGA